MVVWSQFTDFTELQLVNGFYEGDCFPAAVRRGKPWKPREGTFRFCCKHGHAHRVYRGEIPENFPGFKREAITDGYFLYYSNTKIDGPGENMAKTYLGLDVDDDEMQEKLFGIPFSAEETKDIFRSEIVLIVNPGVQS